MKRIFANLVLMCALSGAASAQIQSVRGPQNEIPEYGRADFEINLKGVWNNPYAQQDAALDMIVTAPSGKTLTLPCFHVEGRSGELSRWAARFIPQERGRYSCKFAYSEKGALVSESAETIFEAVAPIGHGILHVNDNWTLRHDDGTLFRGVGENICWESRASDDSKFFKELHEQHDRFNYQVMLPDFAANGGNFIRVWMCSWNFPIDKKDNFNNIRYSATEEPINESAAARLDWMVELCEQLGIRVMLCMGAGEARTDADFFVNEAAMAHHRDRLRYIVARWGYSPAIAMWEFFNEIDNIQFRNPRHPIPHESITSWHASMSSYLKSIDPFGHIVTTSISHRDVVGLNNVPDMDINQKHIYNHSSIIPQTIEDYAKEYGKPYIIGEFGYEWDWSKNFDDFADGMDMDFRRGLWYGLFSPTPVTPMSWWWEYFINRDMVKYFRAPALVGKMMLESGQGSFEKLEVSAQGAEAFALRCGKTVFVYVFNPSEEIVTCVKVDVRGKIRELDIDNVTWGKKKPFKGEIATSVAPRCERLFVIE